MSELNLISIDNIYSTSSVNFDYKHIDKDDLDIMSENLKDQYIYFNNLGINLINYIEDKETKLILLKELIVYINENYTSIVNFDNIFTGDIEEIGEFIYEFFCIDCYNTILPNYINQINCNDINKLELILKTKFNNDSSLFKVSFLKCIKSILDEVLKLEKLDKTIKSDKKYNKLLKKYAYYIDLIDFGHSDRFLNNYIKPVLSKTFNDILWRSN